MWTFKQPVKAKGSKGLYQPTFCLECQREDMAKEQAQKVGEAYTSAILNSTFDVLTRNSLMPSDMTDASFKTFTVSNKTDEEARNFALRVARHYFQNGKGNTVIFGKPAGGIFCCF
jgi:dnaC protein